MKYRRSAVAGMFYPENCQEIKRFIDYLDANMPPLSFDVSPRALIVPHAGYIYSGITANAAFRYAASKLHECDRIVVIGPSHRVYVEGASIALFEGYHSPCATLEIDQAFSHALMQRFSFLTFAPQAHEEHSTEVQMPFIHHYFKHAKIVEIVYGDLSAHELSPLIHAVLQEAKTLLVISTDLSHFHTQEEANVLDRHCINAIQNLDEEALTSGCEACGIIGVSALVHEAAVCSLKPYFIDYRTSFERTQDATNVVGYTSFIVG